MQNWGGGGQEKEENATIRAKLFYKFGVMGDINNRSDIYNSVKIFITDICEDDINKVNISEGSEDKRIGGGKQ